MLKAGAHSNLAPSKLDTQKADSPLGEKGPESHAFDLNANIPPDGQSVAPEDFIPTGTRIAYRSPLFGELSGEVLDDRGEVVWI